MSATPKLVVGLGNPGREYAGTRHNVGFAVVEIARHELGCSLRRKGRFLAGLAGVELWTRPGAPDVFVAEPQTYMNRSGLAVMALLRELRLEPTDMLVVVDDADLPLGDIRLRSSGGSGGHNGLRSIIEALGGNEEFARLRIGIGRPDKGIGVNPDLGVGVNPDKSVGVNPDEGIGVNIGAVAGLPAVAGDITDHVLGRFRADEKKLIGPALARASDAVVACVERGVPAAMNEFNRKEAPPACGAIGDEH